MTYVCTDFCVKMLKIMRKNLPYNVKFSTHHKNNFINEAPLFVPLGGGARATSPPRPPLVPPVPAK